MTKADPSDALSTPAAMSDRFAVDNLGGDERRHGVSAPAAAGDRFARLVEIMRTLRSPRGCAWDREQTLASLRPFVIEEAYEVVEAMDRDDRAALCEELGDLLLEAVFVAQICAEEGAFTIADAAEAVTAKLIRRHPHVFGGGGAEGESGGAGTGDLPPAEGSGAGGGAGAGDLSPAEGGGAGGESGGTGTDDPSPAEVKRQWERIKREERAGRGGRASLLDGIPAALPALLRASRIGARAANVGFDWDEAGQVVDKADEELAELRGAIAEGDPARIEEELGDLLFTVANAARKLRVDPESALRTANAKFTRRFRAVEQRLEDRGRALHDASPDELEREWQAVKTLDPADAGSAEG